MTFANDNYYSWDSSKLWDEYHTVYGLDENLTWVKSNHSFKFGYCYQMMMLNTNNRNTSAGNFTFDRLSTAVPGDNSGNSGSAFASFMLGEVLQRRLHRSEYRDAALPVPRVLRAGRLESHSRLTLNIGLRWELNMGAYEKHDRLSYFDPTLPNPAANGYPGRTALPRDRTGP